MKRTGRFATRPRRQIPNRPKQPDEVVIEVTPANMSDGNWKKWVSEASLFEVQTDDPVK